MTHAEDIAKDPCPLKCGRSFHGLPKDSYGSHLQPCPGPFAANPEPPAEDVA